VLRITPLEGTIDFLLDLRVLILESTERQSTVTVTVAGLGAGAGAGAGVVAFVPLLLPELPELPEVSEPDPDFAEPDGADD